MIVGCFISQHRNYGQRTTSPIEAAHRELKSYLTRGTRDIKKLIDVIDVLLAHKKRAFETELTTQKECLRREYLNANWLGDTVR